MLWKGNDPSLFVSKKLYSFLAEGQHLVCLCTSKPSLFLSTSLVSLSPQFLFIHISSRFLLCWFISPFRFGIVILFQPEDRWQGAEPLADGKNCWYVGLRWAQYGLRHDSQALTFLISLYYYFCGSIVYSRCLWFLWCCIATWIRLSNTSIHM